MKRFFAKPKDDKPQIKEQEAKDQLKQLNNQIQDLQNTLDDLDVRINGTELSIVSVKKLLETKQYARIMSKENLKAFETQKTDLELETKKIKLQLTELQKNRTNLITEIMGQTQKAHTEKEVKAQTAPDIVNNTVGNIQNDAEDKFNNIFQL